MFNKIELVIGALCTVAMATALFLVQERAHLAFIQANNYTAQTIEPGIIFVDESETVNSTEALTSAFEQAIDRNGNFTRMVIDDIKVGVGTEVKENDTVLVHYVGNLQGGLEFDNSRERGEPLEFKVGTGEVIKGWDEGLLGMRVGGERILVIPADKAYGEQGIGPIPGGATLVFKIELLEIK